MSLYEQSGIIIRPATTTDRYGNEKRNYSEEAAELIPVDQLNVQPSSGSTEDTSDKQVSVTTWLLISAPGTVPDLRDTDRIKVDGQTLEVAGKVGRWPTPMRHIEAQLKEVD